MFAVAQHDALAAVGRTAWGAAMMAGRKQVLSLRQRIVVGAECERLWRKLAEESAWARYENQPETIALRTEQRADLIPVGLRRRSQESLAEIKADIEDALDGRGRFVSIPIKRPKGRRALVIKKAIGWCRRKYRIDITARRAEACWKEYRQFVSKNHSIT